MIVLIQYPGIPAEKFIGFPSQYSLHGITGKDNLPRVKAQHRVGYGIENRALERFKFRKGAIIRHGARVGANSTLLPGIEIGREAFVAAGSVVTRDVPPATLVMGVPARPIRSVPEREWAESQ